MFVFNDEHQQHLKVLLSQPVEVITEFSKLGFEFMHKGPNRKVYQIAAKKLKSTPETILNAVEGLSFLLVESSQNDLSELAFRALVLKLGFSEEQHEALGRYYLSKKAEIRGTLKLTSVDLPRYKSLDWRMEVQVASRSLQSQITPMTTLRLTVEEGGKDKDVILRADPVNLRHMLEKLEEALSEGTSQHTRRIAESFKSVDINL